MDSLNTIPNSGSFGDVSAKLNDNFSKVGQSLTTLENVAIANKGYFDTLASLQAAFPSPKAGNIAYVANVASSTGYYIYNVVSGVWTATSTEAPAVGVAISNYAQHGYSSSPKTLKQVDDEVVQLAGDVAYHGYDGSAPKTLKQVEEAVSTRIFPQGWEVDVIDRPDMKLMHPTDNNPGNIPVLDQLGNINHFIKTTSAPGDEIEFDVIELPLYSLVLVDRSNNIIFSLPRSSEEGGGGSETLIHGIYRPDLRKVILDKNDNIFELEKTVENTFGYDFLTYVNPTEKPAFDIREPEYSWGINYDELIQKYDDLMDVANNNPESTIISKGIYGYSGATALPLYYYRLRATDAPKVKIALTSGTHANEKMYIFGLYEIFKDIIESPYQHPTIQWIRDNCEVVFIPCICPESIGFPESINGSRPTPETRPFTASYLSDGSAITITYTQSDFPTENTGLVWNDYFQVQPDKRMITIWSTDDDVVLPRGVYEYTVVNGNTITIPAPTSTVDNGTCEIQVWSDPNRNVDNGKGIYHNTVQSNNIQTLADGAPYALYDHKGTKAGSVQEIRNFVAFLNDEKFDISIDAHCPPIDHYMRGYIDNLFPDNISLMQSIKSFASIFNTSTFDENITNRGVTVYPGWVTAFNGLGVTIEWGSGLVYAADWQVTGAVRWAYTVIIGLLKYSVKHK